MPRRKVETEVKVKVMRESLHMVDVENISRKYGVSERGHRESPLASSSWNTCRMASYVGRVRARQRGSSQVSHVKLAASL